jgi:hypothetical protein
MAREMSIQPTAVEFSEIPFADLQGLSVSKQSVGLARSISIRLSSLDPMESYEIGCFSAGWRVRSGTRIVLGSTELVDSVGSLDDALQKIYFGRFLHSKMIGERDLSLIFEDEFSLDFFRMNSEEIEVFHLICPQNICYELSTEHGWRMGPANVGW